VIPNSDLKLYIEQNLELTVEVDGLSVLLDEMGEDE
jgi:hypothetical protein